MWTPIRLSPIVLPQFPYTSRENNRRWWWLGGGRGDPSLIQPHRHIFLVHQFRFSKTIEETVRYSCTIETFCVGPCMVPLEGNEGCAFFAGPGFAAPQISSSSYSFFPRVLVFALRISGKKRRWWGTLKNKFNPPRRPRLIREFPKEEKKDREKTGWVGGAPDMRRQGE